jgi:hypothetical protein
MHTNKQRKHPPRLLTENLAHRPAVAEGHSHPVAAGAAHREAEAVAQRTVGVEHTRHMQHIASALDAAPFAVDVRLTASLRVRTGRPRADRQSRLSHGLLGLRLGRWQGVSGRLRFEDGRRDEVTNVM